MQEEQELFSTFKKELGGSISVDTEWIGSREHQAVVSDNYAWLAIPGKNHDVGKVVWWSLASESLLQKKEYTFTEHGDPYISFKDNKLLAVTSHDELVSHYQGIKIVVIDPRTGNPEPSFFDNSIKLYVIDCQSGKLEKTVPLMNKIYSRRRFSCANLNSSFVALAVRESTSDYDTLGHSIICMDYEGKELARFDANRVNSFISNKIGTFCALACYGCQEVRLWDTRNKDKKHPQELEALYNVPNSDRKLQYDGLRFNNKGDLLALLFPHKVVLWNVDREQKSTKLYEVSTDTEGGRFSFMPNDRDIIVMKCEYRYFGYQTEQDHYSVVIHDETGKSILLREFLLDRPWTFASGISFVTVNKTHILIGLDSGKLLFWKKDTDA
jgi:hypothetical protein